MLSSSYESMGCWSREGEGASETADNRNMDVGNKWVVNDPASEN